MAEGDIGAKIGELEFDPAAGEYPCIIHVSGTVYAIIYSGVLDDGYITCVNIPTTGNPTLISGGVLEFDEDYCYDPHIIKVADNVYAVVYRGTDLDGFIKTIAITDAGVPTLISGGALEFYTSNCENPHIIHVDGTVYAIAFKGAGDTGRVKTVNITEVGIPTVITDGEVEYDDFYAGYPRIIHVSGNKYAVIYRAAGPVGKLKTLTIPASGVSPVATGESLDFDATNCVWPNIIHVTGEVYAIVYEGDQGDGYLTTVKITSAGVPTLISGGVLEFDTDDGGYPCIIHVSGTVYAIIYSGVLDDGFLLTVTISADGATVALTGQKVEFDTINCYTPDIIHVSGNVYALVYAGEGHDGWIKTYPIETVLAAAVKHLMMMGVG